MSTVQNSLLPLLLTWALTFRSWQWWYSSGLTTAEVDSAGLSNSLSSCIWRRRAHGFASAQPLAPALPLLDHDGDFAPGCHLWGQVAEVSLNSQVIPTSKLVQIQSISFTLVVTKLKTPCSKQFQSHGFKQNLKVFSSKNCNSCLHFSFFFLF